MTEGSKEWMVGLPDQPDLLSTEELQELIRNGQVRESDLVRKNGQTWHAVGDIPELTALFSGRDDPRRKTRRRPLKELPSAPVDVAPAVPLPPPPREEGAMEGKYYSPTDLLRAISHGMALRNIFVSTAILVPTVVLANLVGELFSQTILRYAGISFVVGVGFSWATFVLVHINRSQMEGDVSRIGWAVGWTLRRSYAILALLLTGILPALFFTGILYLVGRLGASNQEAAEAIRILYFIPALFGLGLVGSFVFLQLIII